MRRIEFIYFDLGNVLISFDHSRAWEQISRLTGVPEEGVETTLFHSGLQTQYEKGEISTGDFHRYFCRQTGASISLESLCYAASNIFEPIDESIRFLQSLKMAGHRLGLLSNTCDCHWEFCLADDRFKFLRSGFEQTMLSFKLGLAKPDTEIYRVAANQADCDPAAILFIDDKKENVDAAREYGFDGIHFQTLSGLLADLKNRVLM